jgi:hypothetical protein
VIQETNTSLWFHITSISLSLILSTFSSFFRSSKVCWTVAVVYTAWRFKTKWPSKFSTEEMEPVTIYYVREEETRKCLESFI